MSYGAVVPYNVGMTRTTEHQNPETGTDTDWTVQRERAATFNASTILADRYIDTHENEEN